MTPLRAFTLDHGSTVIRPSLTNPRGGVGHFGPRKSQSVTLVRRVTQSLPPPPGGGVGPRGVRSLPKNFRRLRRQGGTFLGVLMCFYAKHSNAHAKNVLVGPEKLPHFMKFGHFWSHFLGCHLGPRRLRGRKGPPPSPGGGGLGGPGQSVTLKKSVSHPPGGGGGGTPP